MDIKTIPAAELHNGLKMPVIGFGTYQIPDGPDTEFSVLTALETGYRNIDTASFYDNERSVGTAIKKSGIPREEIFITTKVWNSEQGYKNTLEAFDHSRKKLHTDYIDLYLIHWPVRERYIDTWRAMEEIYQKGNAKAIGVCNFNEHHIEDILRRKGITPMVNQIELHPILYQTGLIDFCKSRKIQIEAWAPLMRGRMSNFLLLAELAEKYKISPAQLLIRWDIQHGFVTIPKSAHKERIILNFQVFDFTISNDDMQRIDALNRSERLGPDPERFNF